MHFDIRKLDVTESTNDDVRLAAEGDAAEGLVIWAAQQKAGRGRQGRQWQSPPGNLYFSVLLRPAGEVRDYGRYSFVIALAIGEVLEALLPQAKIELKWPNDVLVNGKKISGILLEAGGGYLIVGIGLNILHVPDNPLYPVTSLAAEQVDAKDEEVLGHILAKMTLWRDRLENEGFTPIRMAWLARAKKGSMRVHVPHAELHGEFFDLDEDGNLCLLLPDKKVQKISAGDVFF